MATLQINNWVGIPGHSFDLIKTLNGTPTKKLKPFQSLGVFLYLGLGADEQGMITESLSTIARGAGIAITTAGSALDFLEDKGLLNIIDREHSRGEISDKLRWEVFKRDHYKCTYCGKDTGPFVLDHIVPVSAGGRTTDKNLTTSCPRCNRHKSNKIIRIISNE